MEDDKYKTLESLRETKKILNGIKGYLKEDEESVELDTLAAIALLRRPELAKRGEEALGDKYRDFTGDLYGIISSTFGSEQIVRSAMCFEAIIRCAEAHNKGVDSEEVYEKYIGIEGTKDSINNLYFGKRLDTIQKQFVADNYDSAFGHYTFTFMVEQDLQEKRISGNIKAK